MELQKLFLWTVLLLISFGAAAQKTDKWDINSPDNNIRFSLSLARGGNTGRMLTYTVSAIKNGKITPVIEASPLGIVREDQRFDNNIQFVSKTAVKTIDEKYRMLIGRQAEIRNHAKEVGFTFKNDKGSQVQVWVRAYNDGVAFKYVFPGRSNIKYTVKNELTGFNLPDEGKTWIEPFDKPTRWGPSYELYYENGIPIGTPSPNVEGWAFPALFQANDHYALISEANLKANYCGSRLEQNADKGLYKVRFPDPKDALGIGRVTPQSTLPWDMPWRTIIIGPSLATIFESQMIHNLSDPAKGDYSWVKPGRSSWSWNTVHESPKDYQALKEFVDLASEMNWEYSLVDANWDLMQGGNILQLSKYAQSKNVGLWLWYNSGGPQNDVTERPRDIMNDPMKRKAEFKKMREWGIKGVKIDFWHSDKQNLIAQYLDVIKDAAQEHIMVNFHGCTLPRGWSRTYPNLLTMEAVKGEENYDFDSTFPAASPVQHSILPFTRNVVGPMDYTPAVFSDLRYPHITSYAHELALTLVFNSGVVHPADHVKVYRSTPSYVQDFLKGLPVTFDETRFISGEPGKSVIIASRKGKDWYLAGINSEKESRDYSIALPFIKSGKYQLNIISDGENTKSFKQTTSTYTAGQALTQTMLGVGGFVAKLESQ